MGVVLLVPATDVSVCLVSDGVVWSARTFGKARSTRSVGAMHLSYRQFVEALCGRRMILGQPYRYARKAGQRTPV